MKLNYKNTLLIGLAFMSISMFWSLYDGEIQLLLNKYIPGEHFWIGVIMAWDNILALFMLPLFGAISDRTHTKWGRRMPYIVIGTIFASVFLIITAVIDANSKVLGGLTFPLFLVALLFTLVSMSIYRSPSVALMPDITIKPLRSKANAIINLMGAIGGVIALFVLIPFLKDKLIARNIVDNVIPLFMGVAILMVIMVLALFITVKENKLVEIKQEEDRKYNINDEDETSNKSKISSAEARSLILILSSVFLWFMGYNAVTSAFSRYVEAQWNYTSYSLLLGMANVGAILAFIPSAMIASKYGRKKTIMGGVILLSGSLGLATFLTGPSVYAYILLFSAGIAWALINVNSYPMIVELSKNSNVGKYTGYYYTFSMAAQIVTPALSGLLFEKIGFEILFPYGALFSILAFFTMFFVKHGDTKNFEVRSLEVFAGDE